MCAKTTFKIRLHLLKLFRENCRLFFPARCRKKFRVGDETLSEMSKALIRVQQMARAAIVYC